MIRMGYVDVLFAGNALATHDIEQSLFGTSLGVYLDEGNPAEAGHAHHLRAINRIRRAGSIRQAVEQGMLGLGHHVRVRPPRDRFRALAAASATTARCPT